MRESSRSHDAVEELGRSLGAGPWSLQEVLSRGWTYAAVRAAVEAGRLIRPHRGVLDVPRDDAPTETRDRHIRRLRAALLVVADDAVVSHESAGCVQRLWLPDQVSSTVHLTHPGEPGRLDHDMRIHRSRLPAGLITVVDGLPVTTVARTAVDVARGHRLPEALLVLDGAARRLAIDRYAVAESALRDRAQRAAVHEQVLGLLSMAYDSVRAWPGSVVVREALVHVDLASESPFESRSRGWMVLEGLPRPELAYEVQGSSGARYFADFAWPERRVLGEADGSGKYGDHAEGVTAALRRERRRQRDLEDAGWTFVRWDSTEGRREVCARLGRVLLA